MTEFSKNKPVPLVDESVTFPEVFQVKLSSFGIFAAVNEEVLDATTNVDSWDGGQKWNDETQQWDPAEAWDPTKPRILFPMSSDETWILVQDNRAVSAFQNPLPNIPQIELADLNKEWEFSRPDDDLSRMVMFTYQDNPDQDKE